MLQQQLVTSSSYHSIQQLNHQALLNICQYFVDLSSLYSFRLSCKYIHEEISNNIEEEFYKFYIQHTLSKFHFSKITSLFDEEEDRTFGIELKNCRKLLQDFLREPFINVQYDENDSDFKRYLGLGGVVRVSMFKPCELLQILMRNLHIKECEKIHKVPFHNEIENEIAELKVSPGKLLLWMCNRPVHPNDELEGSSDEEEIYIDGEYESSSSDDEEYAYVETIENIKYNPPCEISFKLKDAKWNPYGEKSLKYHLISNKPHEERVEDYKMCDIFTFCSRPPSSNYVRKGHEKNFELAVKKLRSNLFNNFENIYTLDWSGTISRNRCWSIFWQKGLEWWGCFAFTLYNIEKGVFIVTLASESD
ncbi:predicted protein [Naegleria gruberi]|uniref:Predicted protein n=1 Tax=Naegleria gruberi TaxID=5762 RepID=D2VGE0_NAEGR|nr:uncharacterized protein NAEGRDRAFT_79881 [Naegleria gruberi]EFC43949.1 predicted protein [Naegleria gruberi]|eukprot:XP_002676693.1 predicted protein [Naegleria gruberi strain NEG-M]